MAPISAKSLLKAAAANKSTMHDFLTTQTFNNELLTQSARKRRSKSPLGFTEIDTNNPDLKSISLGINAIINQMGHVTDTLNTHTQMLTKADNAVESNRAAIKCLESDRNSLQQAQLNDRMQISGLNEIPFTTKKNFRDSIWSFLRGMKIEVEKFEIVDAFYTKPKMKDGTEKYFVTVIFVHEGVKRRIMQDKIELNDENFKGIYFNDVLTQHNRQLIYHARQMKKNGIFSKVGSMNGNIFVKNKKGEKIFVDNVKEMEEIAKLNNNDTQGE